MGERAGSFPGRHLRVWMLAAVLACAPGAPAPLPPEVLQTLEARTERARGLLFSEPIQARLVSRGDVEALLSLGPGP